MPNRHTTLTSLFDDIAEAIRNKGVGSVDGDLKADDFDRSIGQIVTLEEGTSGDDAVAGDLLLGKKAHTANGAPITGIMANNGATGGTITSQGGTYTIPAGYTSGGTVTANLTSGDYTPSVASHSITTTPVVTPSVGGTVANIVTATKPSGTDGTDYWTLDPGGSVTTTGKSSTTAKAVIGTAGYLAKNTTGKTTSADVIDITPTVAAGTNSYIKKASSSSSQPTASATNGTASVTKNPTASASVTANGFTPLASGTSAYYVTASASSASGTVSATGGSASTTAGSVTVGAGYNPSEVTVSVSAKSASGTGASTTEQTASDSKTIYIPEGTHSGTVSTHSVSNPTVTPSIGGTSTNISSTTKPSGTDGTDYWTLDPGGSVTTNGSSTAKATATIGTAGYISTSSGESSASTITLNSDKITIAGGTNRYISKGSVSVSASKGTVSSHSVTVTPKYTNTAGYIPAHSTEVSGTGVSVSASELVSGNKALSSGTSNQTGIDVTNYATVSISAIAAGAYSASVSVTSNGSAEMSASDSLSSYVGSSGDYYVNLSTTAGSVKGTATIDTAGYLGTGSKKSSATDVSVSGNGSKLYLNVKSNWTNPTR